MANILDQLDIVVVTCQSKINESSTIEFLKQQEVPCIVSITPDDHPDPSHFIHNYKEMCPNLIGTYRCFLGHQLAIAKSEKPYTLVFEDDAGVINKDWIQTISDTSDLWDKYDIVSYHGRIYHPKNLKTSQNGYRYTDQFATLPIGPTNYMGKRCLGALAYVINSEGRQKLLQSKFNGVPIDVLLPNFYSFALVNHNKDLFIHELKGRMSLTETAV